MKPKVMTIAKIAVKVIGVAATLATSYFADKELDEKIAKKAAEAVTKNMKEGS